MNAPRHHEADVALRDGSTVHVRPVRAEDAPAVRAFFERLSPRSIALRFFCGFPDLDRAVRWATEVDQHRYSLVATGGSSSTVRAPDGDRMDAGLELSRSEPTAHNHPVSSLLGQPLLRLSGCLYACSEGACSRRLAAFEGSAPPAIAMSVTRPGPRRGACGW